MDKKEYFESLLRRDFLRYVLLRTPYLPEDNVVEQLMDAVAATVDIRQLKDGIRKVIDEHISGRHTGQPVSSARLAKWLSPGIVNDIMADYAGRLDARLSAERAVSVVVSHVERFTWLQGIGGMAVCLKRFLDKAYLRADEYEHVPAGGPEYGSLLEKYDAAAHISLMEYVTGGNSTDVAEYLSELEAFARARCEEVLYSKIGDLYRSVSGSQELHRLANNFDSMRPGLSAVPVYVPAPQPAWDAEYRRLVPVDFYERNIASIDGSRAFQMVLLQTFARCEDELRAEGTLCPDGELQIFTAGTFSPIHWIIHTTSRILQ